MAPTGLTSTPFVHPLTKEALYRAGDGTLVLRTPPRCPVCPAHGAVYDFASVTSPGGDRVHYDGVYDAPRLRLPPVSRTEVMRPWQASPDAGLLLTTLGCLEGRRILLLGNGVCFKELHFLSLGARRVVYTDLSIQAVQAARDAFLASELAPGFQDRIEFHAVDALHLPFAAASFDVVYGYAFVHHLSDLDTFFEEVHRVLPRGGRCCFLDDAYSPFWHGLKGTVLRPLQMYVHWKHGISPADRAATRRRDFTRAQVERIARDHGFREVSFERCLFWEYFCTRGAAKLGGRFLLPWLGPLCRGADTLLDRCGGFTRRHGIRLVWGLRK